MGVVKSDDGVGMYERVSLMFDIGVRKVMYGCIQVRRCCWNQRKGFMGIRPMCQYSRSRCDDRLNVCHKPYAGSNEHHALKIH